MDITSTETSMQFDSQNVVARLRLFGKDAENGIIGVKDSICALQGFQKAFQHIASYYEPAINDESFNLPVALSRGSLITEVMQNWWCVPLVTGSSWFSKAFCEELGKQAGQKVAELFNFRKQDAFAEKMQRVPFLLYRIILIAKHLNGIGANIINETKIIPLANGNFELYNQADEKLEITAEEVDLFKACDQKMFTTLVTPLRPNLQLEYSFVSSNEIKNSVSITNEDKEYFYFPEDEEDDEPAVVLPELEDGRYYELEGKINRVTEKTCSLGFFFKGHTITSIPVDKQLATYKNSFLSKRSNQVLARVRISGIIERKDSSSGFMRNRPVMNFDKLELLDDEYEEGELF